MKVSIPLHLLDQLIEDCRSYWKNGFYVEDKEILNEALDHINKTRKKIDEACPKVEYGVSFILFQVISVAMQRFGAELPEADIHSIVYKFGFDIDCPVGCSNANS
ncbi:MAG: hypothetical protein Q4E88_02865 [Coriobacteriia bacterium]|nr:hypothetical protein [Coriobacteriia bacterium]